MLKFTKDHEWLLIEGDVATVGITPYAQEQLGDLVFVECPWREERSNGRRRGGGRIGQGGIGRLCAGQRRGDEGNAERVNEPTWSIPIPWEMAGCSK